jgi:hydroxylamine reductase (hybrid-cluster protein)
MAATKNLTSDEVIGMITYKVALKKDLRALRKKGDNRKADIIALKIEQLETKLHSRPLAKN